MIDSINNKLKKVISSLIEIESGRKLYKGRA